MKRLHFNILVIGAGPAGLAAAANAAQHTAEIGLVDENPAIGGQIWRNGIHNVPTIQAKNWSERARARHITILSGTKIIAPLQPNVFIAETATETLELHVKRIVLATGARELFLPFPGWTLPGVMGAGGLQALVKGGLPIKGKRVVVAGSGPLLLAVTAYLKRQGAHIQAIVEQASWSKLGKFALQLPRYVEHIKQTSNLGKQIAGIPIHAGSWVKQAHGTDHLESITLCRNKQTLTLPCDYLACGFGLVPNVELAVALGCTVDNGTVEVNEWQQTSIEHIYCAGEATGIGGLEVALIEGQITGLAAAGQHDEARKLFSARKHAHHFASLLEQRFVLRGELKSLADDNTIVCRCEDVLYRDLKKYRSWRSAKLQTRCGMGPCQGRVCGEATTFLFGWGQDSVRPPITAARIMSFAHVDAGLEQQQAEESE